MSVDHIVSMASLNFNDKRNRRYGMYIADLKILTGQEVVDVNRNSSATNKMSSSPMQRSKSVPKLFGRSDSNGDKGARKSKKSAIKKLTRKFSQGTIVFVHPNNDGMSNKKELQKNQAIEICSGPEQFSSSYPPSPSALSTSRSLFKKGKEQNKVTIGNSKSNKFISTFNWIFNLDSSPRESKEELDSNGSLSCSQFSSTSKLNAAEKAKLRHSKSLPDLLDLSLFGTNYENRQERGRRGLASLPRRKGSGSFLGGFPRKLRKKNTQKLRDDKTDSNVGFNESLTRESQQPSDKTMPLADSADWQSGISLPEADLHSLLRRRKHREKIHKDNTKGENQLVLHQKSTNETKHDIHFQYNGNKTMSEGDKNSIFLPRLDDPQLNLREVIDDEIQKVLKDKEYNSDTTNFWCRLISETIKDRLQHFTYGLFKIVVQAFIGAVADDGIFTAMQSNWNAKTDNFISTSFRNKSLFALVSVLLIDFSVPLHGPRTFDNKLYSEVHPRMTKKEHRSMPSPV